MNHSLERITCPTCEPLSDGLLVQGETLADLHFEHFAQTSDWSEIGFQFFQFSCRLRISLI